MLGEVVAEALARGGSLITTGWKTMEWIGCGGLDKPTVGSKEPNPTGTFCESQRAPWQRPRKCHLQPLQEVWGELQDRLEVWWGRPWTKCAAFAALYAEEEHGCGS